MNSINRMLGTVALIGASAVAAAGTAEIVDASGQPAPLATHDQKAVNACADAFLSKIAPGSRFNSQVAAAPGKGGAIGMSKPDLLLVVSMEARTAEHSVLAKATCTVNYDAQVTRLEVQVGDRALLARTSAANIRLATQL